MLIYPTNRRFFIMKTIASAPNRSPIRPFSLQKFVLSRLKFPNSAAIHYLCAMKNLIDLFVALGLRLQNTTNDPSLRQIVENACHENPWFTPHEVHRAIRSLAEQMLLRTKLEAWVGAYPLPVKTPKRVLVIMAGNIPLVGFFDLLCVVISGHFCYVKPSSKDRILMEYIVRLLLEIDPEAPVRIYNEQNEIDALIATGSDNAARYFKTHYKGIPTLLRGSRQSIAVLTGNETPQQMEGLADDIWAYSGLGCRNVSLIFAPKGHHVELKMPETNPKLRNNYLQTRAILRLNNQSFTDLGASVLVEGNRFPKALSQVVVSYYDDLEQVEQWIATNDQALQCIVTNALTHNRQVGFGKAQSPRLTDYPDERDVCRWLTDI